jgi:hypothetical protein
MRIKERNKMTQLRGQLTDRIKAKSVELMGYEITRNELRLMAHIQYVMVNEQKIDISRVNSEERINLHDWKIKGYIEGGASGLGITKEFWDIICEIIFLGYVDLTD